VKVLDLKVDGDQGIGGMGPYFGALNGTKYTAMIHRLCREILVLSDRSRERHRDVFKRSIPASREDPLHPFLAALALRRSVAKRAVHRSRSVRRNMDAPEASAGNTIYSGERRGWSALLRRWTRRDGDGEIDGSAIEVPMHARLQIDLIKGKATRLARFENDKEIMAAGIYRPVDDALRIAFTELVAWIHADYGSARSTRTNCCRRSARFISRRWSIRTTL